MLLRGTLIAETPIYRGNARKTLFTRDGDGRERLVSLAGEIAGTAESLMDAFIGAARNGRNTGLLNQLWERLYGNPLPNGLIKRVDCTLKKESYPRDHFFEMRMGLRLDEDRWASEANANYKMETLYRHSMFDFALDVEEAVLAKGDNATRLYYLLQELVAGRFWFGAGKSKGLGRVRLEMALDAPAGAPPTAQRSANHLQLTLRFNALNPVLVGWNWGKVDPHTPSFAAVEGRLLVGAMRDLPDPIRERLELVLGGPILTPEDWKKKLATYLPRTIAVWLQSQSSGEAEVWTLSAKALDKLSKGKYGLSKKIIEAAEPLCDQPFPTEAAAEAAFAAALGDKANMAGRIVKVMDRRREERRSLNADAWAEVSTAFDFPADLEAEVAAAIADEAALTALLGTACQTVLPRLYMQVDQQIELLQSDAWVDDEIRNREAHLRIKEMIMAGKITEAQWQNRNEPPEGVSGAAWRGFLDDHRRVRLQHMKHPQNLRKSITNDRNFITFLNSYRERTRQELAQPHNVDFRSGGPSNRIVSRKYGKPYDTVFMRMLSWAPSAQETGSWEVFIPGSTLKGAFRKRAAQVLKTLWGESAQTDEVLENLFGAQGRIALARFSDAYLRDPYDPDRSWCSMDGVRMDPKTGRPYESAKHDYLFAYGDHLVFEMRIDMPNLIPDDLAALSLLAHLLEDFQRGDIPVGGEKSAGFGWVQAEIGDLLWLAGPDNPMTAQLFEKRALTPDGIWQKIEMHGAEAADALAFATPLKAQRKIGAPPATQAGFISHRAFGGFCGTLAVEADVLTPLHIRESGEPSFHVELPDGPVNGWDAFSMAPPAAAMRPDIRQYALPSRSLKGLLRHVYAIASDSRAESTDLARLNPVDSLFGWVGPGQNQALMGRLSIGIGMFEAPELAWFKVPYPYTGWRFVNGKWTYTEGQAVPKLQIAQLWRLFPHTPLLPAVARLSDFTADTAQASYVRAVLPGAKARFTVRFWNLEKLELQRLLWCLTLGTDLAHKLGQHRYVGFGSVRFALTPQSFLIDWEKRYAAPDKEWKLPVVPDMWLDTGVIANYAQLREALSAKSL